MGIELIETGIGGGMAEIKQNTKTNKNCGGNGMRMQMHIDINRNANACGKQGRVSQASLRLVVENKL